MQQSNAGPPRAGPAIHDIRPTRRAALLRRRETTYRVAGVPARLQRLTSPPPPPTPVINTLAQSLTTTNRNTTYRGVAPASTIAIAKGGTEAGFCATAVLRSVTSTGLQAKARPPLGVQLERVGLPPLLVPP